MATNAPHLKLAAALAATALLFVPVAAAAVDEAVDPPLRADTCSLRLPARAPDRKVVVPILMYHRINVVTASTPVASRGLSVHPADFARQMTWLKRNGFSTITQRELFEALYCGRSLGKRPIMLTFDDGYRDVFFNASRVLLPLGMK